MIFPSHMHHSMCGDENMKRDLPGTVSQDDIHDFFPSEISSQRSRHC